VVRARPVCCVALPAGLHTAADGVRIDFDDLFERVIEPAVTEARLVAVRLRPDEPHDRLSLASRLIFDTGLASPASWYELGVRHRSDAASTVLLKHESQPAILPVATIGYGTEAAGRVRDAESVALTVARRLLGGGPGGPVAGAAAGYEADLPHERSDVFRTRADYDPKAQVLLASLRARFLTNDENERARVRAEVASFDRKLGDLGLIDAGPLIDLLLTLRALDAWQDMVALVERLPVIVGEARIVQEQYGFALNRLGRAEEAAAVLSAIIERHGPDAEVCGLLGRIHKDRWSSHDDPDDPVARAALSEAIEVYLQGFNTRLPDPYPGVNAVTLMEIAGDPRRESLLTAVRYSIEVHLARASGGDYWDHATLLELAVIGDDRDAARAALKRALALVREGWEPATTARNLQVLRVARAKRGHGDVETGWIAELEVALLTPQGGSEP
jgi:hypothetical protein